MHMHAPNIIHIYTHGTRGDAGIDINQQKRSGFVMIRSLGSQPSLAGPSYSIPTTVLQQVSL